MSASLAFLPVLAAVAALTCLPLVVVLPTAPPMYDDGAPPHRAGWRISITLARVEAHP